jgi:choline dehydrogenase
MGREIAASEPLKSLLLAEERPGADLRSDDALLGYVRRYGGSVFHPAGSCRMGPGQDAVVDHRLAVHGIAGLFVADASVMPVIVSGNTNAASIMIGERAADFVREAA